MVEPPRVSSLACRWPNSRSACPASTRCVRLEPAVDGRSPASWCRRCDGWARSTALCCRRAMRWAFPPRRPWSETIPGSGPARCRRVSSSTESETHIATRPDAPATEIANPPPANRPARRLGPSGRPLPGPRPTPHTCPHSLGRAKPWGGAIDNEMSGALPPGDPALSLLCCRAWRRCFDRRFWIWLAMSPAAAGFAVVRPRRVAGESAGPGAHRTGDTFGPCAEDVSMGPNCGARQPISYCQR